MKLSRIPIVALTLTIIGAILDVAYRWFVESLDRSIRTRGGYS